MKVGILTGGGDCPGLNAVIRAAVKVGAGQHGHEHLGLLHGWRGLLERETMPLGPDAVRGILHRGGTILRSSRTNPYSRDGGPEAAAAAYSQLGLDALIAIGGEDTLGVARRLHEDFDLNVVGVPKTIDNDLSGTDYTFGFATAVQVAVDAIDRLHSTAESHDRVMVVEVMGRHVGWIATYAGLAGGADFILVPEHPRPVSDLVAAIRRRHEAGSEFSIVVVSEGYELEGTEAGGETDEFGHVALADVDVGQELADRIGEATGFDTRSVVLGHIQRGGTPCASDRVLATRFGTAAAHLVARRRFGRMVAQVGDDVRDIPLTDAVAELKAVPPERFAVAEAFFA